MWRPTSRRGPRGFAGHRPRDRLAAGHRADRRRQHALRRIRAAPDQHDVHAVEPVSRDPGGRAADSGEPGKTPGFVHSDQLHRQGGSGPGRLVLVCVFGIFVGGFECDYGYGGLHAVARRCSARPQMRITSGVGSQAAALSTRSTPVPLPAAAVPLSAFTHFERATEPLSINHQGQFPAVTVSFNLAPDAALGAPSRRSIKCRRI